MLKRLYIDNFRCFINFEYKPERKQLLLGANGSGKSSLLDAIKAIKEFVLGTAPGQRTILDPKNRTSWQKVPSQVFEIEGEDQGRTFAYRIETAIDRNLNTCEVTEEVPRDEFPSEGFRNIACVYRRLLQPSELIARGWENE